MILVIYVVSFLLMLALLAFLYPDALISWLDSCFNLIMEWEAKRSHAFQSAIQVQLDRVGDQIEELERELNELEAIQEQVLAETRGETREEARPELIS